ncbi:MAG: glycosyltransferase [Anaerolineae bacterium]|nr:glycosyltransferase [Anaerolineae bacterium]
MATAVGGTPEQVTEGVTGFLTPPGDAEALAGRAASLLVDADVRQRFSAAAAADARARFDRDRMVDDYLGWYGTIVARWFE